MNKELTPLEVSKQLKDFVLEFVKNGLDRMFVRSSFNIIEKELESLEKIDNSVSIIGPIEEMSPDVISKKLKALEIMKKKRLAWVWFIDNKLSFEDYNKSVDFLVGEPAHKPKKLTQEEYGLLKEVLL